MGKERQISHTEEIQINYLAIPPQGQGAQSLTS